MNIPSIHWHPKIGCFETHGAIRARWEKYKFERGRFGYPTSDEHDTTTSANEYEISQGRSALLFGSGGGVIIRESRFQYGRILWNPNDDKISAYELASGSPIYTVGEKILNLFPVFPDS